MAIKCPKCQHENPDDTLYCGKCGAPLNSAGDIAITETIEVQKDELTRGAIFANRYEIIEELGKGGMGRVYRAYDKQLEEEVAIKLLKSEIAADKKTLDRFKNEIKLARKIIHRNVCRMHDLHEEKDTKFITMEYVAGEDLKSQLRRMGKVPIEKAVFIAYQIADGLAEAHRLGVIHRDLKPHNVMIDKEGNARIMDFGIARSLGGRELTGEGVIIGTPDYMSPEQADGKEADARSDIYSLGVILYEMVTGKVPFEGETPFSVAMKHKTEAPIPPKKLNPQIPVDLNSLILHCLEKAPEQRYQTAEEFLSDLSHIEEGLPIPERIIPKRKPTVSREITVKIIPKKLILPASLIFLLAIAAIIFYFFRPHKDLYSPTIDMPSLAILPFENLTGSTELDHWKEMLPELLVSDLLQSKYLNVMTRDSAYDVLKSLGLDEAKKFSRKDLERFAKEARVGHIATGSYLKAGDQFVINLTVQDLKTRKAIKPMRIECKNEAEIIAKANEMTVQIKNDLELSPDEINQDYDEDVSWITTSNPEALRCYIEARKYAQMNNYHQSIEWAKKAVALDPEFAMAYRLLGTMSGNLGYYKERQGAIAKAAEFKDRLSLRERLHIEAYEVSDWKTKIEKSQQILKLYPLDQLTNINLGTIYCRIEDWEKALDCNETLIRNGVNESYAYDNSILLCYLPMGMYDKALTLIEHAPENIRKLILYCVPYIYLNKGDYRRALEEEKKLAQTRSPDYGLRGFAFYLQDDFKRAEEIFRKPVESKDLSLRAVGHLLLHFIYKAQGRFINAEEEIARLIEIAESAGQPLWKTQSLWALITMDINRGEFIKAKEIVDKEMRRLEEAKSPPDFDWIYYKTWIAARMKSFEEAKKALSEFKVLSDKNIQDTGNPKLMRYHDWLKGVISLEENNLSGAIADFEKAVSMFSVPYISNMQGMGDLSWSFIKYADYLYPLARAYYLSGDLEKARQQYEAIIGLSAGRMYSGDLYARSFYMLGKIYEQQGKKGKARENYQKFLDLWKDADPSLAELADARKRLAELHSK